jgi:hypothetical protein
VYRFLDRPVRRLDEHHQFLVAAMRVWTLAVRQGRCPCHALADGFSRRDVAGALRDFGMAMTSLDRDAMQTLRFGHVGMPTTSEDEARLLALFASAMEGDAAVTRRIAATLVAPDAVVRLATATEWIALHLIQSTITENDE